MAVTDPLFAQHEDLLLKWSRLRDGRADSIGVAYPAPHFLLNQDQQPVNWGYGSRMASSQAMQPWYWTSFVMQICEWRVARETRHYKGRNHHWFIAHGPAIDIDTEDDFRLAQLLYRHQSELPHGKQPDRYHQSHYV